MDKEDLIKNINMTPLEKQIIINKSLKDFVYFKNNYLKHEEVDEFIKRIQEGSETMYIRQKINESCAGLKDNPKVEEGAVLKPKPKNGVNIDLKKIIEDNNKPLKNL